MFDNLTAPLTEIRRVLEGFSFLPGNRYTEFVEGETVADYDLVGLVAGGVNIETPDSGSTKWIWRGLLIAFAVFGTIFMRLFKNKIQDAGEEVVEQTHEHV